MPNLHGHHIKESHSKMCALKHLTHCMLCSCFTARFTIHYGFTNMEAQNRVSAKNSYSCPIPVMKVNVVLIMQIPGFGFLFYILNLI